MWTKDDADVQKSIDIGPEEYSQFESALLRGLLEGSSIRSLQAEIARCKCEIALLTSHTRAIETSTIWRATEPLRALGSRFPKLAQITLQMRALARQILHGRKTGLALPKPAPAPGVIEVRLESIKAQVKNDIDAVRIPQPFDPGKLASPKFSIILPTYRPSLTYFEDTVLSVKAQTYQNWELCIADDGSGNDELVAYLERQAESDARIKFCILKQNNGISAASNAALSLATGELVGFLDHDDLLLPRALAQFAIEFVRDPQLDMAYSDEAIIDEYGAPLHIFTKPDWSPVLLLAMMYVGHFTVYRRELVNTVGGFRSAYDFSQDYDLALRATERARKTKHVNKILYCWRAIATSAAAGGKPYARSSNIAAATDALVRRGLAAHSVPLPQSNRFVFNSEALSDKVSVVIPSDNVDHIIQTVASIRDLTTYKNYEIIVVTNSGAIADLDSTETCSDVRFIPYDKPFNFSDKCNAGAAAAQGAIVIFYNDDVRVIEKDWIQALLECFKLDGVGAAAPKLLYEDGTIQHAGMVVGVRRFVGTAFHCRAENTGDHFNLAQSARETTLLSGACLAIRLSIFHQVGGFDSENTPINHSDVDLCLKIWAAGYRCVYTPHATLKHFGHVSIGAATKHARHIRPKDKSDIYLLRRWCTEISYDPYYPPGIRDLTFRDSPENFQVFAPSSPQAYGGQDILIISHDLSRSGAPKMVYEMAATLKKDGHFVVVACPIDGDYRELLRDLGVTVIIDALLFSGVDSVLDFARNFDRVIANTVVTWPVVFQLAPFVDVYWYIHESELVDIIAERDTSFHTATATAKEIWVGSARSLSIVERHARNVFCLEYGLDPWSTLKTAPHEQGLARDGKSRPVVIGVFGSYEPRKGQDLAIEAVRSLPADVRRQCELRLFGRVLNSDFHKEIDAIAATAANIVLHGELTPEQYAQEIQRCDIVLVPSRDDTLPLVSLDALRAGKVLICSQSVGTSEYIGDVRSAIITEHSTPGDFRDGIVQALKRQSEWPQIGLEAKKVFAKHFSKAAFEKRLIERLNLKKPTNIQSNFTMLDEIQ